MPSSLQRSEVEPTDASRVRSAAEGSAAEGCGGSEPDPVVASPLHWFHVYFPGRKFTERLEVLIDGYDTHRATTLASSSPAASFLVANKQGGPSQPLKSSTDTRAQPNLRDCHITSDSIYRYLRQDLVVPFSMEGIAFNVECGDLFIGDLEAGRVEV